MKKGQMFFVAKLVGFIIVILLLVFFIRAAILLLFGSKGPEETSSFNPLAQQVDLMLKRGTAFEYSEQLIILKSSNFAIKGYSNEDGAKPAVCKAEKPCLCLEEGSSDKYTPVSCKSFETDQTVVFLTFSKLPTTDIAPDYPTNMPKSSYAPLFLAKFEPPMSYLANEGIPWDKGVLFYIEKYVSTTKTYIYMVPFTTSFTKADETTRLSALAPCPPESDTECIPATRNSRIGAGFCKYDDGKCTYSEVSKCDTGKFTDKTCLCGETPIEAGKGCFAVSGKLVGMYINCGLITACEDYCKIDELKDECNPEEINNCIANPCKEIVGSKCVTKNEKKTLMKDPEVRQAAQVIEWISCVEKI